MASLGHSELKEIKPYNGYLLKVLHPGPEPSGSVTVKTFGLLLDRAWIWLDFPGFKRYYIKEAYQFDVCFDACGPPTGDFHSDCGYTSVWRHRLQKWFI